MPEILYSGNFSMRTYSNFVQWIHKPSRPPPGDEGAPPVLTASIPLVSTSAWQQSRRARVWVFHSQILQLSTACWLNSTDLKDWSLILQHHRIKLVGCNSILLGPHQGTKTEATRSLTFHYFNRTQSFCLLSLTSKPVVTRILNETCLT